MKQILSILQNKNLVIFILAALLVVASVMQINSCNNLKAQKQKEVQNVNAEKNVLTVEKNKAGENQTSTVAYEGKNAKDVKNYDDSLAKEFTKLKNRKPDVIIQTKVVYIHDTVTVTNNVVNEGNGNYDLNWNWSSKDSTRILAGKSTFGATINGISINITPGQTIIFRDELKLGFTVGEVLNTKTKLKEIFVTPDDPNVHVGSLKGAILGAADKTPSKFSFGTNLGFGMVYNKGLLVPGPCISIGFGYKLF